MPKSNRNQDNLEAEEAHGSFSSIDSAGSDTSVDSSISVTDDLAQVESDLFDAVCSENRTGLSKIFKTANPAVVLRALVHFSYKNEDGRFAHDPEAVHDAQELLGEAVSPLNIIQCACFLGEEDLALDILMYVDTESEHMEARKILYEFMGKVWGNGNTSLHLASFLGMSDLVNLMLNLGSNTNKRNDRKYKPVDCADDDATRALFLNVTEVSRSTESVARGVAEQDIPRERSVSLDRNQQPKSLQLLLLQQQEVDQSSRRHQKAASDSCAAESKKTKTFKGIGKQGDDTSSSIKESSSEHIVEFTTPSLHNHPPGISRKESRRRDHVTFDPLTLLADAATTGDLLLLRDILDRENSKLTVNSPTENKELTPLHLAATHNHLALCKFLISRGALVNAVDVEGWTPLHCAATESNAVIVKYLCEEVDNVDLEGTNADDDTPMDAAEDAEVKRIIADAIAKRGLQPRSQSKRSISSDEAISPPDSDEGALSRRKSDTNLSENADTSSETPRSPTRRGSAYSPRLKLHETSKFGTPIASSSLKRANPVSILKRTDGLKRTLSQGSATQENPSGKSESSSDITQMRNPLEVQSPKPRTEAVNKSDNGVQNRENTSLTSTKTESSSETKFDPIPSPVQRFSPRTDASRPSSSSRPRNSNSSQSPTVPQLSIPSPSTTKPRRPNSLQSPRSQRQVDSPQSPIDSRSSQIPVRKGNSRKNVTEGCGESGGDIQSHTVAQTSNIVIGNQISANEGPSPDSSIKPISANQTHTINTDGSHQANRSPVPLDASIIPVKSPTEVGQIKGLPKANVRISTSRGSLSGGPSKNDVSAGSQTPPSDFQGIYENILTDRENSNSTNTLLSDSKPANLSNASSKTGSADSLDSSTTSKRPHRKSFTTKDKPCLSPSASSLTEVISSAPRSASFKSLCEKFDSPLPERHPPFSSAISTPASNPKASPLSIRKIFSRS